MSIVPVRDPPRDGRVLPFRIDHDVSVRAESRLQIVRTTCRECRKVLLGDTFRTTIPKWVHDGSGARPKFSRIQGKREKTRRRQNESRNNEDDRTCGEE